MKGVDSGHNDSRCQTSDTETKHRKGTIIVAYSDSITQTIRTAMEGAGAEHYADQYPSLINGVVDGLLEREYQIAEQLIGYASSDLGFSEGEAKQAVGRAGLSIRPEPEPEPEAPAAEGSTDEQVLETLKKVLARLDDIETAARRHGVTI